MESKWQCIVVGAGIQGSWTAYHLAKRGYKTLLLEQFRLPHTRGSSHGQTRVIRKAYEEDFQTTMMVHTYTLWRELEKEQETQLIYPVGLLCLASPLGHEVMESVRKSLHKNPSIQHEELTSDDIRRRFPQIKYASYYNAILEHDAGIIRADHALRTVQTAFRQKGGVIRDGFKVSSISPGKQVVITGDSGEEIVGDSLVLCPGPWAPQILKKLDLNPPLVTLAVPVMYFKISGPDKFLPCAFLDFDIHHSTWVPYGMPCFEYPGMAKICIHGGTPADPDDRDRSLRKTDLVQLHTYLSSYVNAHFPGVDPKPAVIERCMYTVTPDELCILDSHPMYSNIAIGCGFSGTGFKMSPIVGEILADLATGKTPVHDIGPFSLNRFPKPAKL